MAGPAVVVLRLDVGVLPEWEEDVQCEIVEVGVGGGGLFDGEAAYDHG